MSISSRDIDEDNKNKNKNIRIWRIEATKEFILVILMIAVVISILVYNPYELRKIGEQALNNTEQIIYNSNLRYQNLSDFMNITEIEDKEMRVDVLNILFLYLKDINKNQEKVMKVLNITNENVVEYNSTHIWTNITDEKILYGYKIPYPLNITNTVVASSSDRS